MLPLRLDEVPFAATAIVCVPEPGSGNEPVAEIQGYNPLGTVLQPQVLEDALTYTPADPPAADTLDVMGAMVKEQTLPNCVSE
jgi:hypothetical protein